jgi:hypothetical protein
MVVVVVAQQDEVDRRQFGERDRRRPHTTRPADSKGLATSENIGSVSMLQPGSCTRNVD